MRLCMIAMMLFLLVPGASAWAQQTNPNVPSIPPGTCTNISSYDICYPDSPCNGNKPGMFSQIKYQIDMVLAPMVQGMFEGIMLSPTVRGAVQAAATLYIAIYGLAFAFGMVPITAFELMIRLVKIGIIVTIFDANSAGGTSTPVNWVDYGGNQHTSTPGYRDFANTFGTFFTYGTDEIINKVTRVAIAGLQDTSTSVSFGDTDASSYVIGGGPFGPMDYAIAMVVSPKMAATMIGAFTTGPYGPGIGIVLIMSLASFLKSLLNAMWVYVMALVMRTFLFALAPIFIPCILFSRTRNLFDGWLNQVINSCLQPIFLFAFFSFFAVLFQACLDQVFQTPVCWTPLKNAEHGGFFDGQLWRWAIFDCIAQNADGTKGAWVPFGGVWDFTGPIGTNPNCGTPPVNPLGIMLPITLWIIADLASRFNEVTVQIAKDISGASTDLRMGVTEKLGQWASGGGADAPAGGAPTPPAGGAAGGNRTAPGGSVAGVIPEGAKNEVSKTYNTISDAYKNLVTSRNKVDK